MVIVPKSSELVLIEQVIDIETKQQEMKYVHNYNKCII